MATDAPEDVKSLESLAKQIALRQQDLRDFVAAEIISLFKWSVGSTVLITMALVVIDTVMLWTKTIRPEERLVSEHVLFALIGASVVQVGVASAAIAYGMFGRPDPSGEAGQDEEA